VFLLMLWYLFPVRAVVLIVYSAGVWVCDVFLRFPLLVILVV
jgi:hypothetical protein